MPSPYYLCLRAVEPGVMAPGVAWPGVIAVLYEGVASHARVDGVMPGVSLPFMRPGVSSQPFCRPGVSSQRLALGVWGFDR